MTAHQYVCGSLLFLFPFSADAAFDRLVTGGRQAALAGATVALARDPGGGFGNPAGLLGLPGFTVAATVSPALYGIEELQHAAASAVLPVVWGAIGVTASTIGISGYRETTAAVTLAVHCGRGAGLGFRLNTLWLGITGYGNTMVPACDAGFHYVVTQSFAIGCLLANVTGTRLGPQQEALPRSLECGFAFAPPDSPVMVCAAAAKELLSPLDWRIGVAYGPYDCLILRTGISTEPAFLSGGFGIVVAPVVIDYAVTHHWQLGLTHHVSITVAFE